MHEMSRCKSLIEQIDRVQKQHPQNKVVSITLRAGPLASINPDHFIETFVKASAGTVAEAVQVQFERQSKSTNCPFCDTELTTASHSVMRCTRCKNNLIDYLADDSLWLVSVDLAEDPHAQSAH